MTVRTHTHTIKPADNPYLKCHTCGSHVTARHDIDDCGCTGRTFNWPCFHEDGVISACVNWTPEGRCTCPVPCDYWTTP